MLHIASHFLLPLGVAIAIYRPRWISAWFILISTMFVDLDHLLASPVYDPNRCSIDFHPLHTTPAIALYAALFAGAVLVGKRSDVPRVRAAARVAHLVGLGLLIHMTLDLSECVLQSSAGL